MEILNFTIIYSILFIYVKILKFMKTTVEYKSVKFRQDDKTITCDLVSEIKLDSVPNMKYFKQIPEVAAYIKKISDARGKVILHTRGTTTCLETDEFDYATGKNIAYTKAQSQVFRKTAEIYYEITNRVAHELDAISFNADVASVKCDIHAAELAGRAETSESIQALKEFISYL